MRRVTTAAMIAAALLLAGCSSSSSSSSGSTSNANAGGSSPVTVRLGFLSNITHAPALVAMKEGFFTKALGSAGTLKATAFSAGTEETTAILSGQLDAAYVGPNPAITAWQKSSDIQWELATARSVNLLELLTNRYGISESRLSIASPGAFSPKGSNDTVDGRAENRRVEIVILPETPPSLITEPAPLAKLN